MRWNLNHVLTLCLRFYDGNLTFYKYVGWGLNLHLVVDGYGGDHDKLKDKGLILKFLNEYPASIGMTKLISPQIYTYSGKVAEDWGLSGFVLIAESHISIHTFPDRGYVNIDIFSCKDFDTDVSVKGIEEIFCLPEIKVWTMNRGVDYSTSAEAYQGMVRDRMNIDIPGGL